MSPAWDIAPLDGKGGMGAPVFAAANGLVVPPTGYNVGEWGHYVRLEHEGGLATGYAHLSDLRVVMGQFVWAGQVIGLAGDTGRATGVHLHLETYRDGVRVDPAPHWERR